MDRHPGFNSLYIASDYQVMPLLKTLESLNGGYSGNNCPNNRKTQKHPHHNQLYAHAQQLQLLWLSLDVVPTLL